MHVPAMLRIGPATPGSTGSSFEEELRDVILGRLWLAAITGFAISIITYVFEHVVLEGRVVAPGFTQVEHVPGGGFDRLGSILHLGFVASFGIGAALLLFVRDWTTRGLRILDYTLISFNLLLANALAGLVVPEQPPLFAVALLLFIHAAFIPVPVRYQLGLAATAFLTYPLALAGGYGLAAPIREFWAARGGAPALQTTILTGTFAYAILGAVSVLITRTLYSMRKSLHQARRLGNYVIDHEIGKGGMGEVYVATHALMCRPTAVKVLRSENGDPTALARFEREVRLSATLTHPNTITIFDFGRTKDNTFYYAMEYLQGLDLQLLVERFGPLPASRVVHILAQACGSLAEAHARGIVHRDIKPSNIFLTRRGDIHDFVKVLDFGLAKEIDRDLAASLTRGGTLIGTPRYFAPETIHGAERVDARADIYNLGGVAYWMLVGEPPFPATSPLEMIVDHVRTTPRRPSEVSELEIPLELEEIVMKCLRKAPQERFQSVKELRAALLAIEFAEPWTEEKGAEWWSLHVPAEELEVTCIDPEVRMPVPVEIARAAAAR